MVDEGVLGTFNFFIFNFVQKFYKKSYNNLKI